MKKILLCMLFIFIAISSPCAASDISVEISTSDIKLVKDSTMAVMSKADGVRIKSSDEYRIVMEKEYPDGLVSFLTMNLHTMRKPVCRLYFDIMPQPSSTIIKIYANNVVNPDSNREELYPVTNKNDIGAMQDILERIKHEVQQRLSADEPQTAPTAKNNIEKSVNIGWELDDNKIMSVEKGGIADSAHLQPGDIILRINGIDAKGFRGPINKFVAIRYEINQLCTLDCVDKEGIPKTVTIGSDIAIKHGPYLPQGYNTPEGGG